MKTKLKLFEKYGGRPPQEDAAWLEWLDKRLWFPRFRYTALPDGCTEPIRRLKTKDIDRIKGIILQQRLPCDLRLSEDHAELVVYRRPLRPRPSRLEEIVRIRDTHLPRGDSYHPRFKTIGHAILSKIAFDPENLKACERAGIQIRSSLRPPP